MKQGNIYKIKITSDDRKRLCDQNFRFWPRRRKIIVLILLLYLQVASVWLISRQTGLVNTLKANPYRVVGIVFLVFSVLCLVLFIVVNMLERKIASRFLPGNELEVDIKPEEITVNHVTISKENLKSVFRHQDFMFISFLLEGKIKYITLPLKGGLSKEILETMENCGYEINEISSPSDLPWKIKK